MANSLTSWSAPNWAKATLAPSFYERPTVTVAKELLGKVLVVKEGDSYLAGRIVEAEAYSGEDPAAHSARGKTPRCAPMFEAPGRAYVYFIYGMYEMLNFVTESTGRPGAVLIRALEPLAGQSHMQRRRTTTKNLTNGPGKLTQALGIDRSFNRLSLQGPRLFVMDDGYCVQTIRVSPRVGIREAKELPWRFYLDDNAHVSRARENRLSEVVR